jgi:NitT/TauT family transport system ATP-binding protein
LAVSPAILLMDEPLSALDAQTRDLLMEDFLELWLAARTTSVYVTHNLQEALRLADRICVLSRRPGRIKEIVSVDMPQAERGKPAAARDLAELNARLWTLIKAEASAADREVADV